MPAVVVTGARQTGKSTLAEHLVPGQRRYRSLDDLDVLDAARRDPEVLASSYSYEVAYTPRCSSAGASR